MASWPEIAIVKSNNRCELVLSGKSVSERIESKGLDDELFTCTNLNFLRISETSLKSIPSKIDSLHNLTSLVLHSNKLTELCSEIGNLTKLKLLDASNNEIKAIPESLSKLEALSTLKLSFNKIEKIPNLSQNKWLSIVDLSCNEIEDISEICHNELVHLVELHLKGNKIKEIPSSIKELSALKILNMNENQIVQIPGEVSDIPKLKEVNFQGNPIGDKKLLRIVTQGKSKSILEYVREHSVRENGDHAGQKGKKGKSKGRTKHNSTEGENEQGATSKHKILVTKTDDMCIIKRADYCQTVRPHIIACVVKNVTLDVDTMKKFIQLQTRLHEGICDKRNAATIATHDLDLCKGRKFTYTAVSPDGLKITPLSRNKEFSGKELFTQLQTEADNVRKEKKRNTYSGIHKYLHLLEGKPLYPCLLNSENTVISFPPITNSDLTKINVNTKNILIEVTSSTSQNVCKKVADALLKEMVLASIAVTVDENETQCLTVEQVRIEETDGNLIAVYPSRADLVYEDGAVIVVRD